MLGGGVVSAHVTTPGRIELSPEAEQRLATLQALGALEYRTRDLRRALGDDARPDVAEALAELERAVGAVVEAVRER